MKYQDVKIIKKQTYHQYSFLTASELKGLIICDRYQCVVEGLPTNLNYKQLNSINVFDKKLLKGMEWKWYENNKQNSWVQMYIKFKEVEQCNNAIKMLDGFKFPDGRQLKARYRYTKYCPLWIHNNVCGIKNCPWIHQLITNIEDYVSKQEIDEYNSKKCGIIHPMNELSNTNTSSITWNYQESKLSPSKLKTLVLRNKYKCVIEGMPVDFTYDQLHSIHVFKRSLLKGMKSKWYKRGRNGSQIFMRFRSPKECNDAIKLLNGYRFSDGRELKARHKYTKYCPSWIEHNFCYSKHCTFRHELVEDIETDIVSKHEIDEYNAKQCGVINLDINQIKNIV